MEKEQPTEKQIAVWEETTDGGNECPNCASHGGQHLEITNPGEDWTQTHCAYCRAYINLDNYVQKK
jgi:hypothetical protein